MLTVILYLMMVQQVSSCNGCFEAIDISKVPAGSILTHDDKGNWVWKKCAPEGPKKLVKCTYVPVDVPPGYPGPVVDGKRLMAGRDGLCPTASEKRVSCPEKEPIDVPAITKSVLIRKKGEYFSCGQDACFASKDMYDNEWTCKDESRILLESVDGKHHWCHKVQP